MIYGIYVDNCRGAMMIPPVATVYREWPSGACRAVITGDGALGDCAALPPFHDVVWVSRSWNGPRAGGAPLEEKEGT